MNNIYILYLNNQTIKFIGTRCCGVKTMAWEEFERNGTIGLSGDEPVDEMMLALKRISTEARG